MPPVTSAGLLMYRRGGGELEVFLVHPGGPFFMRKDEGAWSIPKGEVTRGEDPLDTALREFQEETGLTPGDELVSLGSVQQRSGKIVHAWAFETAISGDVKVQSNQYLLEWPPKSGKKKSFPEVDRGAFYRADEARRKIIQAQAAFLDRLIGILAKRS